MSGGHWLVALCVQFAVTLEHHREGRGLAVSYWRVLGPFCLICDLASTSGPVQITGDSGAPPGLARRSEAEEMVRVPDPCLVRRNDVRRRRHVVADRSFVLG